MSRNLRRYGLSFMPDEILRAEVEAIYATANKKKKSFDIHKNVLDPFSAIFGAGFDSLSKLEWIERESLRQFDKSLSNSLGAFHQRMIGHLPGWKDLGHGGVWDLRSTTNFGPRNTLVFAELKNKHNTMNSESSKKLHDKFSGALELPEYKKNTAYLIEVIPKNPTVTDEPWAPAYKTKTDRIRRITARDIYGISTGIDDAFEKMAVALPKVIDDVLGAQKGWPTDFVFADFYSRAFRG